MVKLETVLIGVGSLYLAVIIYTDFIESTNGYVLFSQQIWITNPTRILEAVTFPSVGLVLLLAGIARAIITRRNKTKICKFCKQENSDENGVFCKSCKETIAKIVANDLNINPTGNSIQP